MSNTLPADTLLMDLQPTRFLKVQDLTERWKVREITVTIDSITKEEVEPKPGQKKYNPCFTSKQTRGQFTRKVLSLRHK